MCVCLSVCVCVGSMCVMVPLPLQLHVASSNGYMEVIDFLLEKHGVNLDIVDNEGWTPFHAAVCWDERDVMKKLAEKGATLDLKNIRGETPYGKVFYLFIYLLFFFFNFEVPVNLPVY